MPQAPMPPTPRKVRGFRAAKLGNSLAAGELKPPGQLSSSSFAEQEQLGSSSSSLAAKVLQEQRIRARPEPGPTAPESRRRRAATFRVRIRLRRTVRFRKVSRPKPSGPPPQNREGARRRFTPNDRARLRGALRESAAPI